VCLLFLVRQKLSYQGVLLVNKTPNALSKQMKMKTLWHKLSIGDVLQKINSSEQGLNKDEVGLRLEKYGTNKLIEKKKRKPLVLFLLKFTDFMIITLIIAAFIAGIAGDLTDAIIIIIIVLLNALISFIQEFKAEKAMTALKKMSAQQVNVMRDGKPQNIPAENLIPGDLILLEAGNIVGADVRLIETNQHIHQLSHGIMPVQIDAEGLRSALAELAATMNTSKVTCTFDFHGACIIRSNFVATQLYRIAQESVTNALKHGFSSDIRILLAQDSHQTILEISDNGIGFDMQKNNGLSQSSGLGLAIMNYRANAIDGELRVGGNSNNGTTVRCIIPILGTTP
jgi:signal transduction histidine kinase